MKKQTPDKTRQISLRTLKEKYPKQSFQLVLDHHIWKVYEDNPYEKALAKLTGSSLTECCLFSFFDKRRKKQKELIRIELEKVLKASMGQESKEISFSKENVKVLFSNPITANILNDNKSLWPKALNRAVNELNRVREVEEQAREQTLLLLTTRHL